MQCVPVMVDMEYPFVYPSRFNRIRDNFNLWPANDSETAQVKLYPGRAGFHFQSLGNKMLAIRKFILSEYSCSSIRAWM